MQAPRAFFPATMAGTADVVFSWQGAFVAFVAFQNFIGLDIAKKAYKAHFEDAGIQPGSNHKTTGAAFALNLVLQTVTAALIGGFATGMSENIMQSTMPQQFEQI